MPAYALIVIAVMLYVHYQETQADRYVYYKLGLGEEEEEKSTCEK